MFIFLYFRLSRKNHVNSGDLWLVFIKHKLGRICLVFDIFRFYLLYSPILGVCLEAMHSREKTISPYLKGKNSETREKIKFLLENK